MKRFILLFFSLALFTFHSAFAQNFVVKGTVVSHEDNEPLIGVTVLQEGTTNGVRLSQNTLRWPFLCPQKNRASPNFAKPELARFPIFLYLRESSLDIPKIMFKSYTSNDNLLLPPCLGDFIPQNDPVRVVHRIIEQINLEELYRKYSTKGCSAYHPRMMLQILVYAYLRNIYSSRRIEEFCRNDIRFMWLTGNVTPDHNTINRFRSSRLKDVLKTVFATIVKFLVAEGFVSLDVACTDGTKMEANANRYTFVLGKSIHTRISGIAEQLEEIWQYAESVTKQELRDSAPVTYQDITPEKVEKALGQIDDALNGVDADKKVKAKVRRVRKSWPEQFRKYESQGQRGVNRRKGEIQVICLCNYSFVKSAPCDLNCLC